MSTYRVETDKGVYEVETEDQAPQEPPKDASSAAESLAFERSPDYPTSAMTDPSVNDALTVDGVAGLGKAAGKLAAKAVAPAIEGGAETVAKYAGRMGENQMGKLHGTSAYQFRQLGREDFGDIMRRSYDEGDANLFKGSIGREEAINGRVADLGAKIGDARTQAGQGMSGPEMADAIRKELGPEYAPGGAKFDQAGRLEAQLQNLQQMKSPSVKDWAQRATDINAEAAKNKLFQPAGTDTDVANQIAKLNDQTMAKKLPAELVEDYQQNKEAFGETKPLLPMELRHEAKEATGKAMSGTVLGMAKDVIGGTIGMPKIGAQAGFGAEKMLSGVAGMAGKAATFDPVSSIMTAMTKNPQSLGKFLLPLSQAAQSGGQQGVAAAHFVLSHQYPEYNEMFR